MEDVKDKELADLEKQIEAERAKAPEPEPQAIEAAKEPEAPTPSSESDVKPESSVAGNTNGSTNETELYKKKGWKTPEDALKSYAELEKEFHKKNEELKAIKERQGYDAPSYTPPVNPYTPPAYYPPPQAYIPPPNYASPSFPPPPIGSQAEEQVAASYQMTVEDFRKIFPMINDMTEVKNRKVQNEFFQWRDQLTRETEKNADKTNVLGDPSFYNRDVQDEMHEFFSKNPQVFNERKPYSIALKEALANIGRKNTSRGVHTNSSLPTEPPKTAGSSNGFQGKKNSLPSEVEFKKLSVEDQEKMLRNMRAFKTYDDLA